MENILNILHKVTGKNSHIVIVAIALFLFPTCEKNYDRPIGNNKVELSGTVIESVSYYSIKIRSDLKKGEDNLIEDYGFCWSTNPKPDLTSEHLSFGNTNKNIQFSATIGNLKPGMRYYILSFVKLTTGIIYDSPIEFMTLLTGRPISVTDTIKEVLYTTAKCSGTVIADSGLLVTKRGICWSKSQNPSLIDYYETAGQGLGSYEVQLFNLSPSTTYFIRSFAVNDSGTSYGIQKSFITKSLSVPMVSTKDISVASSTSVTSGGNITSDGGSAIIARGVCWSTNPNPSFSDNHTSDGTGIGNYTSSVTGLNENTTYYLRAYAINSKGTAYGNELTFNLTLPSVTTNVISNITQTTAKSGGNVLSSGGSPVKLRGVCWSTSSGPTISNSHTSNGSGIGTFGSSITGLTSNTTYHIRAYATNSSGTAYGDELSFITLQNPVVPTLTTATATNITQTSALSGGNVTSDGGASVTAYGVCWSTSPSPDLGDSYTYDGNGTGSFTSSISGLNSNTTYYIRAYASNNVGTSYGNQISFKTLDEVTYFIGQNYNGGVIFYIDNTGQHGLIASTSDQVDGIGWYNGSYIVTGANETAIGTGNSNTEKIIDALGNGTYAAHTCYLLWIGYYGDWFLPSKDELDVLFDLTGPASLDENSYYWSSTESGGSGFGSGAWYSSKYFGGYGGPTFTAKLRAIRKF